MDYATVMDQLEKSGSEQTCKTYRRHGVKDPMFGVSFAVYGKMQKAIKQDDALARRLWATGNHDARMLGLMVADPALAKLEDLKKWADGLDNYVLTGQFAKYAGQSPHAAALFKLWKDEKHEWKSSVAWLIAGMLAASPDMPGTDAGKLLTEIEKKIHKAPNRTRYEMNGAVIAVGTRGDALAKAAVATAKRIGTVEVDHGETGCKTPDAASYIQKVLDYQAAKTRRTSKPLRASRIAKGGKSAKIKK